MLTIDDVRAIPLFSTLAVTELERLAQTSADLHLGAGEFAVHEGGDRALYAVLAGKIEVVKLIDGVERTLGWRVPGQIFGEVPIAFGTVFVRLSGVRTHASHACGSESVLRRCGGVAGDHCEGRYARTRAHRRTPGHRRRTAHAARKDGRSPLGHRVRRVASLPRATRLPMTG
jgi:CRP-like cAMP-binding protein